MPYRYAVVPSDGEKITLSAGRLSVPHRPILPFIEGNGTGPDIWGAALRVFDAAVEKAYTGKRSIAWMQVYAGELAHNRYGEWLPPETIEGFAEFPAGIEGPLPPPIGGAVRLLNGRPRIELDLHVW